METTTTFALPNCQNYNRSHRYGESWPLPGFPTAYTLLIVSSRLWKSVSSLHTNSSILVLISFTLDVSETHGRTLCLAVCRLVLLYLHCPNTTLTFKLLIFFYKSTRPGILFSLFNQCCSFKCHLDRAPCHVRETLLRGCLNHNTLGPRLRETAWLITDVWRTGLLLAAPSVGIGPWVFKKANCM